MTCPSNLIWPDVRSTRPATMRSVVVFPHPDGPSNVTNSPSAMSARKLSTATVDPYRFVTSSTWTRVIASLVICAKRDSNQIRTLEIAGSEEAEEDQYNDKRNELHGRGQRRGRRLKTRRPSEVVNPQCRSRRARSSDEERHQELVEDDDEREQDAGTDPRSQQRNLDPPERLHSCGS